MSLGKKWENLDKKTRFKCWFIEHFVPVKKNKIVFSQFGGKGYGCNPRAICDEFLRRDEKYDLVWILGKTRDPKKEGIPEGVRTVSSTAILELLTAKVWINNIHFNKQIENGLYKRKGTIYLNTFHGGITLKNEGKDKHTYNEKKELSTKEKMYRKDAEFVDYITSSCDAENHVLEEFFYGKGEILKLGDARTDVFFQGSDEMVKKVREKYNIPEGTRIAIYAPTFRSDMDLKWYDLDFEKVLDTLEKESGEPWVMLIRLHPRLESKAKQIVPKSPRFINASKYMDMQELEVASDLLISDYSSVITDFMFTGRPAFMYVPDLDKYLKSRGLYYKMEELPFPYAKTTEDLLEEIRTFDLQKYQEKTKQFLDQIGCINDGQSAKRIVDFLIEKMNEKR
ncbi:MAG: CDP-glycerol glycerophosphotransferase family protein [Lachnospiraceae bacterium]